MSRKTSEELDTIKKRLGYDTIFSWSRYNTYKNSPYEFYLCYIKKEKPTRESIYGVSGNLVHNILEDFYSDKIEYDDMIDEYEAGLLNMNMMGLKYDRSDDERNQSIADKYEACIRHFFKNHKVIDKKLELERHILIKVRDYLFQGYVDAIHKDNDGNYVITDWKTSTIYSGKKIDQEKGQLLLYAEGLRQMGVPLEKIRAQWAFLKYMTISMPQKNGKTRVTNAERHAWVGKVKNNAKMWLRDTERYTDEEIDDMLDYSVEFNTIDNLPSDIQELYKIEDCYVEAEVSEEEIDRLFDDMEGTLREIAKKEQEYDKTGDDEVFCETVTNRNSYYFAHLCGYNAAQHKPYGRFLDTLESGIDNEYRTDKNASEKNSDTAWMEELGLM